MILALITSGLRGTGDFFADQAFRREPVVRVLLWAHCIGLVAVAIAAPFLADTAARRDLLVGALAGLISLAGTVLLVWAFTHSSVAAVAPLSALVSVLVPIVWAQARDNDPISQTLLLGVILCLAAVIAVSWEPGSLGEPVVVSPAAAGAGLTAGICFGSVVLLYSDLSRASAPWPVVSGRMATALLLLAITHWRGTSPRPGPVLGFATVAGVGDTFAQVTLLLACTAATGSNELSTVAVVAGLHPASAALWCRVGDRQVLGPLRLGGLALGVAAVVLILAE